MQTQTMTYEEWAERNPDLLNQAEDCPKCLTEGTVNCPACSGFGTWTDTNTNEQEICDECDGKGKVDCPTCEGYGTVNSGIQIYKDQRNKDMQLLARSEWIH